MKPKKPEVLAVRPRSHRFSETPIGQAELKTNSDGAIVGQAEGALAQEAMVRGVDLVNELLPRAPQKA